jgi:hypothetical protein
MLGKGNASRHDFDMPEHSRDNVNLDELIRCRIWCRSGSLVRVKCRPGVASKYFGSG